MKSWWASLRTLVLPAGATSGPRIVLDGVNGLIEVYDTTGALYASISPAGGVRVQDPTNPARNVRITVNEPTDPGDPILSFATGDVDEFEAGHVVADIVGAGGTRNPGLRLSTPIIDAGAGAGFLDLTGSSADGTEEGDLTAVLGGTNYSASLPFGVRTVIVAGVDDPLTAGVEEQFDTLTLSEIVLAGRWYRIEGEASFDNVTTRVLLRLRYTTDGSLPTAASPMLKQAVLNTVAAGPTGGTGRVVAWYEAPATQQLRVGLFLHADNNITAQGAPPEVAGFLAITDHGRN